MFVRTPYNYSMDEASVASGLSCPEPSLAQQQFVDETDINTIVERFGLTGQMPDNPRVPRYGDFCGVSDYQSALNAVKAAEAAFLEFPAELRARFDHSPQRLLEFVEDGRNLEEARKLGIVPSADPVPVGTPVPEAPKAS